MTAATTIFGKDAFRKRYKPDASRYPINKALFECWSVSLSQLNDSQLQRLKERSNTLMTKFMDTMSNDHTFEGAISQGTGDISKVKRRFSTIERLIEEVLLLNQQPQKNNFALQSVHLHNFKCFEDQLLRLRPLTLLSGLNSTGKSSVIQALLLLRQSYQQGLLRKTGLALNGDLVNIGTAIDALFEGAKEDSIGFDLTLENGITKQWRFLYDREVDVLNLSSSETDDTAKIYDTSLFNDNFHYLQAERLGPRRFFEISDFLVRQRKQLGPAGEYAAYFLSVFGDSLISHQHLAHPDAVSLSLRAQVEAWLGEISPGTLISLSPSSNTDTISLQFSFATSNKYRATNVG